ncbi:MAG TPA: ATP-binding protein, partial [Gemmata sp.]|nr:ATP-binding protein [Gemmata sp.]
TVAVRVIGGEVVIEVSDEGCGIAPADQDRVFEPFFRSAQARWVGTSGVGLGLTVTRRLVTLLGGRVSVESEAGTGSRSRITLARDTSSLQAGESGELPQARAVG